MYTYERGGDSYEQELEEIIESFTLWTVTDGDDEEVVFDGCGTAMSYGDTDWYNNFTKLYPYMSNTEINEVCYSESNQLAIIAFRSYECSGAGIIRYDSKHNEYATATINHDGYEPLCGGNFVEFGKRNGRLIPVLNYDCSNNQVLEYTYNYVTNEAEFNKIVRSEDIPCT